MSLFYNVKGASVSGGQVTTELVAPNSDLDIRSMLLVNTQDSADATVTLFAQDDPTSGVTSTYEITHAVIIPATVSLFLNTATMFMFPKEYGLYITVTGNDTLDVIIKT